MCLFGWLRFCPQGKKGETPSLLKLLLGEYDLSRVKAVRWGVNTLRTGKTVKDTGIWFHPSGILGASPDGIFCWPWNCSWGQVSIHWTKPHHRRGSQIRNILPWENWKWTVWIEETPCLLASGPRRNLLHTQEVFLFCCMDYKGCSYSKNRKGRKLGGQHPTLNTILPRTVFPKNSGRKIVVQLIFSRLSIWVMDIIESFILGWGVGWGLW